MRKSCKHFLFKTNLLILLFGLFVVTCLGQNKRPFDCTEDNWDCSCVKYHKIIASECGEKGYDCWFAQYTKIIESNPNDGQAYFERGKFSFFEKELDRAVQDFIKTSELDPKCNQVPKMLGVTYEKMGKFDQAIEVYSKAIELFPNNDFLNYRATSYYQKRDFVNALADYNKIIEIYPKVAGAYRSRGVVYEALVKFDKALADYNKAIELNPKGWLHYYTRGHFYLSQGEKAKSEADLQKAKELKELEEKQ